MSRVLIVAVCVSMLISAVGAQRASGETAVVSDISNFVYGTAKYLTGTNNNQRHYVRYYPQQSYEVSQPSGDYVVAESSRFPGSYYMKNGKHYYRPAASEHGQPTVVTRGEYGHVADLAKRLEYESRTMCHDMADNYRDNPNYPQMYREAYRIWELAKQIKEQRGDADQVGVLVRDLDSRFQPLRREVSTWSSNNQQGEQTLQAKVDRAEAAIHHLWNDVGPTQNTWVARKDAAPMLQAPQNATILK